MPKETQPAGTTVPEVHIGREIRNYMERGRLSASWLAEKLCCDRTNIYKMFGRPSLDSETLLRISVFLRHDFFAIYTRAYNICRASDVIGNTAEKAGEAGTGTDE